MFDPSANIHRVIISRRALDVVINALDYQLDDMVNENPPPPQVKIDEVASILKMAQSWQAQESESPYVPSIGSQS